MDPNNEVNTNIANAYTQMLALEEKKKNGKHKMPDGSMMKDDDPSMSEDNTNNKSDDGEGLDKVQPKALKKKFKDRKDKDIDNDGDVDKSDEYLDNRRKTVSKEIDKDDGKELDQSKPKVTDATPEKDDDDDRDEKGSVLKKDTDKKKTNEAQKESVELDEGADFKSTFDGLKKGDMVTIKYGSSIKKQQEGTFKVTFKSIVGKAKVGKITLVKQGEGAAKVKHYLYDRNGKVSMAMGDMGASMTSLVKESVELDEAEDLRSIGLKILNTKVDILDEALSPGQIAAMKKSYATTGDRISMELGQKLSKMIKKLPDDELIQLANANIKWISTSAMTTLIIKGKKVKDFMESVEELDEKRVGDAPQNVDTWDKQVAGRRANDVLDTEMTEQEFIAMHKSETPEFVDGPKVANKTMDAIKASVKTGPKRNGDSNIGESVELDEATPMQRALDKVKAKPKDKVSLKKAPWDKEDVKKESLGNKSEVDQGTLAKVQKKLNSMGKDAPKVVKDKSGYFHIKGKGSVDGPFHTMAQVLKGLESMNKFPTNTSATQGKRMGESVEVDVKSEESVFTNMKNILDSMNKK